MSIGCRIVQRSPARLVDVSASSNQSAGKLKVAFERDDHQRAFVLLCPGFNVGFRPVDQHAGNLGRWLADRHEQPVDALGVPRIRIETSLQERFDRSRVILLDGNEVVLIGSSFRWKKSNKNK
jgi:hypothetical protein